LPTRPEELVGGFQNGTLAWAPDGRRLAAVTQGTAGVSIWIVEIEGATAYRKVIDISGGPRLRGVTWTRDGSAIIVGKHDVSSSDIVMMDAAP
jgi:Tol biopolymer transport system component